MTATRKREPPVRSRNATHRARRVDRGRVAAVADERARATCAMPRPRGDRLLHVGASSTRPTATSSSTASTGCCRPSSSSSCSASTPCRGRRFMRESAAGPIGTGMLLAMLGFGLVWLVKVPVRRGRQLVGSPARRLEGRLLRARVRRLARSSASSSCSSRCPCSSSWGSPGWSETGGGSPAASSFVGLATLFVFISPYLDHRRARDRGPEAGRRRAPARADPGRRGCRGARSRTSTGTRPRPTPTRPGIGPSRKVFLWNTLLDGRFSDERGARRHRARVRPPVAEPPAEGDRLVRALRHPRRLGDRSHHAPARRDAARPRPCRLRCSCSPR